MAETAHSLYRRFFIFGLTNQGALKWGDKLYLFFLKIAIMAPITRPNRIPVKIQLIIVMIIYLIAVYCFELYKELIACLLAEKNCVRRNLRDVMEKGIGF
ncbi:hypothetical protein [Xenorhabdus doucetiae]|uniref:hypothetical protein n=1 Tax=Xenorhabdus doucetiae TaxID=351671 RepID=UPI0030DBBF1A